MEERSALQRYRLPIIIVAVVGAVALLGIWAFGSAGATAYSCSTIYQPGATPSPAPDADPQPGFIQPDMGARHVQTGTEVTYTYCPPATGPHYNAPNRGPIPPGVYGPDQTALPQGWVHNLEHGALVILYRGQDGDPGLSDETQATIESFFQGLPPSPICGLPPTQANAGVVIARFDEMATPFSALVWGRILPLDTWDEDAIMEFWTTMGERTNPERFCPLPTPTPAGSPDVSPSPS
jgi:hypothetical protein